MPALVDTTIRLLGQEPLAGRMPTAELLRLAEILDGAGFAYLEVSGGGVFDTAVRRGVESPWERIRALKARTKTPLALALRGRFLVGSRPVGGDFVRRFVACAAESGIDVFRLHDPLNDVSNLREAGEAITAAGREFDAGLVYSPGPHAARPTRSSSRPRKLPELGAARVLLHDPSGSLAAAPRARARRARSREASGLPVGLYCQGAGGNALAAALEAARAGADLIACAVYPVALTLHRVSGEALAAGARRARPRHRRRRRRALARLRPRRRAHRRRAGHAARAADRRARRASTASRRASSPRSTTHLRAHAAGDRLDEVLDELDADPRRGRLAAARRADRPDPRLAGAPPRALGEPLPDRRRRAARRWSRAASARRPAPIDPTVQRAVELVAGDAPPEEDPRRRSTSCASRREGLAVERGGAAPARALRRGGRAAAARRSAGARERRRDASAPAASTRRAPSGSASSCGSSRSRASAR